MLATILVKTIPNCTPCKNELHYQLVVPIQGSINHHKFTNLLSPQYMYVSSTCHHDHNCPDCIWYTARQAATSCKSPDNYSWLVLLDISIWLHLMGIRALN